MLSHRTNSISSEPVAMASATANPLHHPARPFSHVHCSTSHAASSPLVCKSWHANQLYKLSKFTGHRKPTAVSKASSDNDGSVTDVNSDDGISLGTMKLPVNTDLSRFETLLFQVRKPFNCLNTSSALCFMVSFPRLCKLNQNTSVTCNRRNQSVDWAARTRHDKSSSSSIS